MPLALPAALLAVTAAQATLDGKIDDVLTACDSDGVNYNQEARRHCTDAIATLEAKTCRSKFKPTP